MLHVQFYDSTSTTDYVQIMANEYVYSLAMVQTFFITKCAFFCHCITLRNTFISHLLWVGKYHKERHQRGSLITGSGSRGPTLIICLRAPEFLVTPLTLRKAENPSSTRCNKRLFDKLRRHSISGISLRLKKQQTL